MLPPLGTLLAVSLMLVNVLRVNPSFGPQYFLRDDVKALREFAALGAPQDLLFSWWDYGWVLWYYTGRNNTLIDNGRHGIDTYLAARLLMSNNQNFIANALDYFGDRQLEGLKKGENEVLKYVAREQNLPPLLRSFTYSKPPTKLHRQEYLLLHRDMLLTFPTLDRFARTDLESGQESPPSMLYISNLKKPISPNEAVIYGDTFTFDTRNGFLVGMDGARTQVQGAINIIGNQVIAAKQYNPRAPMHLIFYNKTKAIYLDDHAIDTFLVQALLLDRYDHALFEKVGQTDRMKIFKLR